jgi:predicted MPP superfamily phosphohydrolase
MIFYILLALIAAVLIYMYIEAGWFKVERFDFPKSGTGLNKTGSGGTGLKIMHLTDLHVYLTRVPASKIRETVLEENPDIILISGDYIDKPVHILHFLRYLDAFSKGYRTIVCLGNHDLRALGRRKPGIDKFIADMEALRVEVLINRTVVVEKQGKKYNIVGIDDLREGHPDISKALAGCVPGIPKISLTHNPDLVLHIPDKCVDYMFCGHFHGGQIWMPFNLEFFLLRNDQLCRMGIKRGYHEVNGIKMYLNRGLGNVMVPMRLFSRPEILISTIE